MRVRAFDIDSTLRTPGTFRRGPRRAFVALAVACSWLALAAAPSAAATKTSTGSGNWNTSGTWSPSGVPGAGDSVVIASGHNVTLNANGICGVLNVVGTLTYDSNTSGRNLLVTTSSGMTGNVRCSGTIDIGNNSCLFGCGTGQYMAIQGSFYCTGAINNNGSISHFDFTGTGSQTITNTDNFGEVVVNSSSLTLTAQSNLDIIYDLTVSAGTLDLGSYTANRSSSGGTITVASGATLRIGGTRTFPSNYTTHTLGSTSTVEYYGTSQTVTDENYGHLTLSGSGTKTLPGTAVSVAGDFTMSGTPSATAASAWTVGGDVTIGSGCTFGAGSYSHSFGGDLAVDGAFTGSTSTVTFTGAASNTVSGSGTVSFNNVTVNKGTSSANVLDVTATITMASGGLTLTNGTFKLSSASTITAFTSDITTAPYRIPGTAGLWVNGGTVSVTSDITPAGLIRVSSGTLNLGDATDERVLSSWATFVIEGGAVNVAGRLTRRTTGEGHYFTMSGGTFTVPTVGSTNTTYGPFTMDDAGSSFTMSGGTIVIRRSGGSNLGYTNLAGTTNVTGGTLRIGDASTPAAQTILVNSTAPIWNLTVDGSNSPVAQLSTNALTVKGDITLTSGTFNANNLGLTVAGHWTNNVSAAAYTPGTATTTFNGTSPQTIGGSYGTTFNTLTYSGSSTATLGAHATVNSNFNVSSGTFDLGAYTANRASSGGTITVSSGATLKIGGTGGFPSNYTTTTLGATSTVDYSGTTQTVAVRSYGHLTISGSGTKTLAGNTTPAGNLTVSAGTFDLSTYTCNRSSAGGTITVSNGATLKIGGTNGFPSNYSTTSLGATSTVEYAGTTQTVAVRSYGHLTISGSGTKTLAGTTTPAGDLTVSAGTFDLATYTCDRSSAGGTITVSNGATLKIGGTNGFPANYSTTALGATSTVDYAGSTQSVAGAAYGHLLVSAAGTKTLAAVATCAGDLTVSAGTLDLGTYTADRTSSGGTITVSNGATLGIGGTGGFPANYTTATLGATSTVAYAGTAQSVGGVAYGHLTISGGSTKTLAASASVAGTLTLTSGNVVTGSHTLSITSTGSVSRTSGHVVGNLRKNVATGAPTRTFEIGDATNYTPVALSFASVTVAGDLTASTAGSEQANLATSTISPQRSVNRNWTLTNSGITFTNCTATFTFTAGDVDAGASTGSFVAGRYSGGSWTYPTVGSRTSTTTEVTGLAAFGDFAIGETANYSVSASNGSFAFGTQLANAWLTPQSSVLTNDGNIDADLVGQITTFTSGGNTWTIDPGANGVNALRAQWSTTGASGPWNDIGAYDSDFTIASDVALGGSVTVWVRIQTPTSTAAYTEYASTLKVFAR
jgi:hypothetical protein